MVLTVDDFQEINEEIKDLDYGSISISVKNGKPVHLEAKRDIILTEGKRLSKNRKKAKNYK